MRVLGIFFSACFAWALLSAAGAAQPRDYATEGDFWAQTMLRGLSFDGLNSGIVRHAARQSFELSGGGAVDLGKWYSPDFPNLSASFETKVSRNMSLVWGGSLGEAGAKYRLGPSGTIGFVMRQPVGAHGTLSLEVIAQTGGALREGTCRADYGSIGGVQAVNCRLAASTLSPRQTLQYRWDLPSTTVAQVQLKYEIKF